MLDSLTPEDRAIFDRWPIQLEASLRFADREAASLTKASLSRYGSVAFAVAYGEGGSRVVARQDLRAVS